MVKESERLKAIVHESTFMGNMYTDIVPLDDICRRGSRCWWQHLSLLLMYTSVQHSSPCSQDYG